MKKNNHKINPLTTVILMGAMIAFLPISISAHYLDPKFPNQYMAAVGADGHDHEVAQVPAVTSDGHTDHAHSPEPVVASDGHTDHAHDVGGSSILLPGSGTWWAVMAVSLILMSLLYVGVWKYLQVAPVKPTEVKPEEKK